MLAFTLPVRSGDSQAVHVPVGDVRRSRARASDVHARRAPAATRAAYPRHRGFLAFSLFRDRLCGKLGPYANCSGASAAELALTCLPPRTYRATLAHVGCVEPATRHKGYDRRLRSRCSGFETPKGNKIKRKKKRQKTERRSYRLSRAVGSTHFYFSCQMRPLMGPLAGRCEIEFSVSAPPPARPEGLGPPLQKTKTQCFLL